MSAPSDVLRQRFLGSARAALERLQQCAVLLDRDPRDANVLDTLRRELHRLRGSSGSYGFTEAGERIAEMEQRARTWAVDPMLEAEHRGALLRRVVDALHTAFGGAPDRADDVDVREIWCVAPPAGRVAEWSKVATTAGMRFVVMSGSEFSGRVGHRERPYAVIAPADLGRGLPIPDGVPLVLLSGDRHAPAPASRSFGAVTVVEQDIAADDLTVIIERLAQRTSVTGGSVVILDDDPLILLLSRAICESAGLRAITIEDPALLFRTLEDERPGVLLMDVQLPGTTGFDLTRRLRADAEWAELPVILFSADASKEARENAVAAGADGFLPKPVAPAELRTQLLARLEQVREHRLAHGLNPATSLPEREVGLREAALLFGAQRREGGVLSAAMIRLRDPADEVRWPQLCARLARALRETGAALAHHDSLSLVATVRDGYYPMLLALNTLRAADPEGDEAPWVLGLAEAAAVAPLHVEELWHAAADAAAVALTSRQDNHVWTREDSTRAPDVVIVEDDPAISDLLEYALRQEGYTFTVLRTGPEALEALRAMPVVALKPLVLLDLDLPGLDGHAVHERLLMDRPRDFVVVFLSAHAGDADQVRALRAGAADYLAKPVSLRVLLSKLPRWVRQPRSAP
jgi:DNA-binding response OmpR family regulator/HPt (histidine-containing phosphotransfer) domain-containing protein